MRILVDENVRPAHRSALKAGSHEILEVERIREKGISDTDVLRTARERAAVLLTYDTKDFIDATDHSGILITDETMAPRSVRRAVDRIEAAYPSLDGVVDFLSDWV